MVIAAAQTIPNDRDINKNLNDHYRFIEFASGHQVNLIVFPELSLTGYQREQAEPFSFSNEDSRLSKLQELASKYQMTIIAGAPIRLDSGLHIGSFIISPDKQTNIYTKQFLHEGEEKFYKVTEKHNPQICLEEDRFSLAICADINEPSHPENAFKARNTIYIASLFYTYNGIHEGCFKLKEYAKQYSMNILMSNFGGESWGLEAGGRSSFWDSSLEIESSLGYKGEGLIVARKGAEGWTADGFEFK